MIGRARRNVVCTIVIGALATGACTKTTGKIVMGVGGAATVGTLIAIGARDCSAEDACESPRAEAFVLPAALAVTLAGFLIWATSDQPEPTPVPATALVAVTVPPPPAAPPDPVDLTERARYAARAGQCDAVARLSTQVAELDREHHERSFVTDRPIARCLGKAALPGQPGGQ